MTNMTKDYYKILEITEYSTQEEIKSAYRKLARMYHPDIAGNNSDVIIKFKEINEAYETLSNLIKKNDYDKARRFYNYSSKNNKEANNSTNPQQKTECKKDVKNKQNKKQKSSFMSEVEEFFAEKIKENKTNDKKENFIPQKGKDIHSDVEITIEEAINGTTKIINMLQTSVCQNCGGRKFVNGSLCPFCKGKGDSVKHKKFKVKIPAGIKNKSKIRLSEEGEKGLNGGRNGDLYLTVHIKEPKEFKTEGLNIIKTIQIRPQDAVLGTMIKVTTPCGTVSVKINPYTQNNQKIRLSGCGHKQAEKTGDMILVVEVKIPQTLTEEELSLYSRLRDINNDTSYSF